MTLFQLLMLGASAYFAFKIYEHIQTLQDPQESNEQDSFSRDDSTQRSVSAFSTVSARELADKADEAFENEDYEKALAFLLEANEKDGENPDTLFKTGYILQMKEDYDSALDYYKKALEIDKENEYIHNSIASVYRANKEYTSAKMHLNESLAINDKNPVTYYNYGNLLVDMDSIDEAARMYEKALELDPDFKEAKAELENIRDI